VHNRCGNLHNLLIQEILNIRKPLRPTSAIIGKTGFVISRSPVRSRRVAPSIWSGINQLLTNSKLKVRVNCLELAHKAAHRNVGCGGASGPKLLENTEWGQFGSAGESFETGEY
jgi:hypothetical protein